MNLLSDKIAMTYGSLNAEPDFDAGWNRYTTVNEFAFIDNDELLSIVIAPNLFINCKVIVFIDPETGEDLEVLPYMEMTEEEFFQYTTVYDFGACDFDDIQFAKKHICALQGLAGNFQRKVTEQIQRWQADLEANLTREIAHEIDKDLMQKLTNLDWSPAEIAIPQPPTPTKIASMQLFSDTLMTQMITDSCVSFKAMNQGNP